MPLMTGVLESVSRDRLMDEATKQPYYLGIVSINKADVPDEYRARLRPGMPAEVIVGRVTELRVPLAGRNMRLHLSNNGLPAAMLPAQGWFEVGECMALVKRTTALL